VLKRFGENGERSGARCLVKATFDGTHCSAQTVRSGEPLRLKRKEKKNWRFSCRKIGLKGLLKLVLFEGSFLKLNILYYKKNIGHTIY
jgi:hypothetical protein